MNSMIDYVKEYQFVIFLFFALYIGYAQSRVKKTNNEEYGKLCEMNAKKYLRLQLLAVGVCSVSLLIWLCGVI